MRSGADDGTVHGQLCALANNDKNDTMECLDVDLSHVGMDMQADLDCRQVCKPAVRYRTRHRSTDMASQPTSQPAASNVKLLQCVYLTMCAYIMYASHMYMNLRTVLYYRTTYLQLYKMGMTKVPFITRPGHLNPISARTLFRCSLPDMLVRRPRERHADYCNGVHTVA